MGGKKNAGQAIVNAGQAIVDAGQGIVKKVGGQNKLAFVEPGVLESQWRLPL